MATPVYLQHTTLMCPVVNIQQYGPEGAWVVRIAHSSSTGQMPARSPSILWLPVLLTSAERQECTRCNVIDTRRCAGDATVF
jgi:hypothetical protein